MKPYLTKELFEQQREIACKLDFACNYFEIVDYQTASQICNGIGAYWFNEKLRKLISALNPSLEIVANNHDLGFALSDGSDTSFHLVNAAFKINGYKMASYNYGWYNPLRYFVRKQSRLFTELCDDFGYRTYVESIKAWKKGLEK